MVVYTRNEVAMAADSRTSGENLSQTDDACKVSAPGGKFLFGATGVVSATGHISFNANDEASRLIQSNPSGDWPVRTIAGRWGEVMKGKLESLPAGDLERAANYTHGGGNLVCSVFASADQAGGIDVVKSNLRYQGSDGVHPRIGSEIEVVRLTKLTGIVTCGYDDVVGEYVSGRGQPAVAERERWKSYAEGQEARIAIRLVELTITFQEPKNIDGRSIIDVGGPVDAVELKRGGQIEWIQRKSNCPAD